MMETANEKIIRRLPKVDLHVHLDGSVRPGTIVDLAAERGIELPETDVSRLLPYMQVDEQCGSLKQYLSKFDFTTPFLQTEHSLERVAYEIVEDAFSHNCRYIEVRFAPQLHRSFGMSADAAIAAVVAGLNRAERQFGVAARAIAICMRHHGAKQNMEVVEAAARYAGRGIGAVDLAGDEASFGPELFRDVFAVSRGKGLKVTIHAGEAGGAGNVLEAVAGLGAVRIGHGVRIREDRAVMNMIGERRIPLELCPVSNIQTKAVPDWKAYPIREYFEEGIVVTINTDNPTVSATDITKEYSIVADKFGFTPAELAAIAMNGVEAAFLEEDEKRALKKRFRLELAELGIVV